jgi:pimeloyl-ACP methyl ester carboxylesterase
VIDFVATVRGLARGLLVMVLLVGMVLVVGMVTGMLDALQRQLTYFPDAAQVPPAGDVIGGARDVVLHTADGLELGAWFVPAATRAEANTGMAVLFAPGNGGNRAGRAGLAEELTRRGLAVLLMDYRGYGGNPGSPSEAGLSADAFAAAEALDALGYPPERTIYFGESLGTGVVAALQTRRPPAGLVLRSPFTELADVGAHHYPWLPVRLLLRDRFLVEEHLSSTRVPVTVIYGDQDSVVPTALSARVADSSPSLVERMVVRGADHNDAVMFGPRVAQAVARLAATVSKS